MPSYRLVAAALTALMAGTVSARADEVRYYRENGVTYCETRRTVQERVPQSRMEERPETFYREQFTTEMRQTTRTHWTPRTEYRREAYWVGRWNPLVEPYVAYRYVPRTCWEMHNEVVQVPVTTRRLVPETRTVRRPVASWRTVQKEVVDRVAVRGSAAHGQAAAVARHGPIGGISRLDGHPPRYGTATAWRPSSATIR